MVRVRCPWEAADTDHDVLDDDLDKAARRCPDFWWWLDAGTLDSIRVTNLW